MVSAAWIRDRSQPRASAGIARTTMLILSVALVQLTEDASEDSKARFGCVQCWKVEQRWEGLEQRVFRSQSPTRHETCWIATGLTLAGNCNEPENWCCARIAWVHGNRIFSEPPPPAVRRLSRITQHLLQ